MRIRFSLALLAPLLAAGSIRAGGPICFEAEWTTNAAPPMRIVERDTVLSATTWPILGGASGESYLDVPEGAGNPPDVTTGEAGYIFDVEKAGTYYLWCRVCWNGECSNSFAISLDGAPPFTFGQDATYRIWQWVKAPPRLKQLELNAGRHVLRILNREDGIRLDQILLTTDRRYVPVGVEDTTLELDTGP